MMYNIIKFARVEEVDMHSSSTNSPECPEGYRRYVYRINVELPFKIEFPTVLPYKDPINYDTLESDDDDDDDDE